MGEATPGATPDAVPDAAPGATSDASPGTTPGATPHARGGDGVGGDVEVVRVDDRHVEALAAFMQAAWRSIATPESIRRARERSARSNPITPGEPSPMFLYLVNGQAVGYVGTMPLRLWAAGTELPVHWVKGLMVLPEFRNGPVGFMILRAAAMELEHAMALVVEPAACRLYAALGFEDLGVIPNLMRILEPARLLRQLDLDGLGLSDAPGWLRRGVALAQRPGVAGLTGSLSGVGMRLWRALRGGYRGLRIEYGDRIDPRVCVTIWERMRPGLAASPVRDAGYVPARYAKEQDRYRHAIVLAGDEPRGLVVVRRPHEQGDPRLRGIRVATVSELLIPPHDVPAGLAALAAAEELAREAGADALLCSASHGSAINLLQRRAFIRVPGNLHFFLRMTPEGSALPREQRRWWLTRGDSEADDAF